MFGEEGKKPLPVKLEETGVLDDNTSYAIQTKELTKIVDNTITGTGQVVVHHTIRNPLDSAGKIQAKQEALKEIRVNDKLRQGAVNLLERVQRYENSASELFNEGWFSDLYDFQEKVRTILISLSEWAKEMPEPESGYLREIKHDLILVLAMLMLVTMLLVETVPDIIAPLITFPCFQVEPGS